MVKKNIKNIKLFYVAKEQIEAKKLWLEERFQQCSTIKQTMLFHAFIPIDSNTLLVKFTSNSQTGKEVNLKKNNKRKKVTKQNSAKKKKK